MGLPYDQRDHFDKAHGGWPDGAEYDQSWRYVHPDEKEGEWKKVERGNKRIKKVDPYHILISNRYASLPAFSAPPDPIQNIASKQIIKTPIHHQSHY